MFRRYAFAVLLFAGILAAQTTSQINGTVTDKSGANMAEVKVTVTNVDTQLTREAISNENGFYIAPLLPPGRYRVRVVKESFKPVVQENIALEVNQTARLDFSLELGAVTESVLVEATAPLVESETSSVGQVIETKQIEDLPLNGRNFVQLAILGPGVTGVGYGASGTIMSGSRPDDLRPGSEIFSNGNREGSNNFMFDGIDNNERLTLSITLRPSVEAVRVQDSDQHVAAEQGAAPGQRST
ncbi:MAG: carboxypeptidase-like regulatory domain-containing protein [Bryobacteraceae bacterium]